MDFRSLEVFVWVATLGSFRGAAARLNTTQPAVSQRIAQLESELGVRLLERTRRNVVPTDRGRILLAGAERLLGLATALRAEVGDPDATRGSLRLGVAETVVHTWLPRFLEAVARRYPRLEIEVEVDLEGESEEEEAELDELDQLDGSEPRTRRPRRPHEEPVMPDPQTAHLDLQVPDHSDEDDNPLTDESVPLGAGTFNHDSADDAPPAETVGPDGSPLVGVPSTRSEQNGAKLR